MKVHMVYIKRLDETVLDSVYLQEYKAKERKTELIKKQDAARVIAIKCEKCPMKKMSRTKFTRKKEDVIDYCEKLSPDETRSHNVKCTNQVYSDYEYFGEIYFVETTEAIE